MSKSSELSDVSALGEGLSTQSAAGEIVHLWQKPAAPATTSLVRFRSGAQETELSAPSSDDFIMSRYEVSSTGDLRIDWDPARTSVSLCYAFHPERVFDEGIRILRQRPESVVDCQRYRLHLSPPFGWMNDPNGSIELSGRAHVFYQHYPHTRWWSTMHWAHAVSENLIDWIHLPIFLNPRTEMLVDSGKGGGMFSGSAIAHAKGGLRIFHTDREDGRQPQQEWQMTAISLDAIEASPSKALIDEAPPVPGFGKDLRDPFVFRGPDGVWKMILGGADRTAALVLLYESEEPDAASGWRFVGVLHREALDRAVPAECPCLIALEDEGAGLFALVFGLIGHRTLVKGRRNPSFVLVGRFDGANFTEIARRELDFIGDCYAFQSFSWKGRPIGIAWAANWADVPRLRDFESCMTFPRRLVWSAGEILTPPVDEVEMLRSGRLVTQVAELTSGVRLASGLAEIRLATDGGNTPFRLDLTHPDGDFSIEFNGVDLEFLDERAAQRGRTPRSVVHAISPSELVVYVDVGLIEIFVDGGRWCGTRRIDSGMPIETVRLSAAPGAIVAAEVWSLRPRKGI